MTAQLLTLAEVEAKVGFKKSWIYAEPTFPKPVKINGRNRWVASEVDAFIQKAVERRDRLATVS